MKKRLWKSTLALLLTLIMVLSSGVNIFAAAAVTPVAPTSEEYFTFAIEDGIVKIKINPEKVNDVIKDGELTKEELLSFVPADVLETLKKGKDVTLDELIALVSQNIDVDQFRELVKLVPTATLSKHFDLSVLTDLVTTDELLALVDVNELLALVDADDVRALVNPEVSALLLNENLRAKLTDDVLKDLINDGVFVNDILADDELKSKVISEELVVSLYSGGYIGNLDVEETLRSAVDKGYITDQDITDNFGTDLTNVTIIDVFDADIITVDEMIDVCGGENWLMDKLVNDSDFRNVLIEAILDSEDLNLADYWNHVDIVKVIDKLGGHKELISLYSPTELKDILLAIGVDNVKDFVIDSGIVKKIDYKQILLDTIDLVKSKKGDIKSAAKELAYSFLGMLLSDVDGIYVNETPVFSTGAFNINNILYAVIDAIPDFEKLLSLGTDDVFAEFTVRFDLAGNSEDFSLGIECGFLGDPTNLQKTLAEYKEIFDISVDQGLNVNTSVVLPEKIFADVYKKALESESVNAQLKELMLKLPSLDIDDAVEAVEGITDDQIATLVDFLRKEKIQETIDKLDGSARVYAQKIYDKFVSVDAFKVYRQKAVAAINKLPEAARAKTVGEYYTADGVWFLQNSFSVDLYNAISKVVTLPEDIKLLFNNDFEISGSVTASLTTKGIYKVTLAGADNARAISDPVDTVYLPAGVSLDVISSIVPSESGWSLGDGITLDTMPAGDVTLYNNDDFNYIHFINSDTNEVVEIVRYLEGATSIDEPDVPQKEGHFAKWSEYELNSDNVVYVYSEYEEYPTYTVTFKVEGNVVAVVPYTYGDTALSSIPDINDGAAYFRPGYSYAWPETIELDNTSFVVDAVRTAKKFTVNFVAGTTVAGSITNVTVETDLNSIANLIPTVPTRDGYSGAWETFDLTDYSKVVNGVMTVNAVYTPNIYTISFYADGELVRSIDYTFGATSVDAPDVPAKTGYTGVWGSYDLSVPGNIRVDAVYTANIYKAYFYADDTLVGVVEFTVEDKSIAEPAVPQKDGYTGAWEAYTLGASDITIKAIYTPIAGTPGATTTTTASGGIFGNAAFWWIIIIVLILIIIALIIFLVIKSRGDDDDDNTPAPEPTPAPVVEEIEEIEEVEEVEEVVEAPVIDVPEELDANIADTLMSDDSAMDDVQVIYSEKKTAKSKAIINIGIINSNFNDGDAVDLEALKAKKLVPAKTDYIKILANGSLDKALTVTANSFSVQTIKMIKLKNGTVIIQK